MANDDIISSAIGRLFKIGGLVTKMGATLLSDKTTALFRTPEGKVEHNSLSWLKNAEHLVATLGQLKGGAMKIGQMLSLQEGIFPPEFTNILRSLQQKAPPVKFETLEGVLKESLPNYKDIFDTIEETPFAAASIGQVHRALLDSGEEVAVKIQYPNMRKVIKSDLKNMKPLFFLLTNMIVKVDMREVWQEFSHQLMLEVDYKLELKNQNDFILLFEHVNFVEIPTPILQASSANVLTSTMLKGLDLEEASQADSVIRNKWGENLFRVFMIQFYVHGILQADPNAANYAFLPNGNIILYDFGQVKELPSIIPESYKKTSRALSENRFQDIADYLKQMGLHHKDGRAVKEEIVIKNVEVFASIFANGRYQFLPDAHMMTRLMEISKEHFLDSLDIVFPPEIIFLNRSFIGLIGNLTKLRAENDWGAIMREYI